MTASSRLTPSPADRLLSSSLGLRGHARQVLELPVEWCEDAVLIKKQYRKISLSVHPDKNSHPQADAAFRKVYGAFETLSDPGAQRKLLFTLSLGGASDAEKARFESEGAEDDDDSLFRARAHTLSGRSRSPHPPPFRPASRARAAGLCTRGARGRCTPMPMGI